MHYTAMQTWAWVHKWSSLVCTAFLLMLCLTGLPLIFHDEIDEFFSPSDWQPANPGAELMSLDQIVRIAQDNRPGERPLYLSFDIDRPVVNVTTAPPTDSSQPDFHLMPYDLTSGDQVPFPEDASSAVMHFLLQLHTDMFLGLPGMLFLGFMGLLFAVATVSGIVLYAPFMRKIPFGTLRREKSRRLLWLDYHNLLGVVTIVWALLVGLTGVVNTLADPIIDGWRNAELADLIAQHQSVESSEHWASVDEAVASALTLAPDMEPQFIAFPGARYSTPGHFAVFLHGRTPVTEHIISPVLVNARTGEVEGRREMPWYAKTLALSRPLHFGDYGGMTLKVIWALLDLVLIAVLISGLYLWLRRGAGRSRIATDVTSLEEQTA